MPDTVELILFAILFLGWVVRTVLENKKKPPPRPAPHHEPAEPHAPHAPPPHPAPPSRTAPPHRTGRRERRPQFEEAEEAQRVEPAPVPTVAPAPTRPAPFEPHGFAPMAEVQGLSVGSLEAATAAIAEEGLRRRRDVVRRLGGPEGASLHDLTRAGVLWSEVLGPPRANTGPHRPPNVLRPRR